jgi:hypothetical protein
MKSVGLRCQQLLDIPQAQMVGTNYLDRCGEG